MDAVTAKYVALQLLSLSATVWYGNSLGKSPSYPASATIPSNIATLVPELERVMFAGQAVLTGADPSANTVPNAGQAQVPPQQQVAVAGTAVPVAPAAPAAVPQPVAAAPAAAAVAPVAPPAPAAAVAKPAAAKPAAAPAPAAPAAPARHKRSIVDEVSDVAHVVSDAVEGLADQLDTAVAEPAAETAVEAPAEAEASPLSRRRRDIGGVISEVADTVADGAEAVHEVTGGRLSKLIIDSARNAQIDHATPQQSVGIYAVGV